MKINHRAEAERHASQADMRDALTLLRRREAATRDRVARHIAIGLTSKNRGRWSAARSLAQDLDAADANVDNAIEEELADGGNDPKAAWDGSHLPDEPDPWAEKAATEKADPLRSLLATLIERWEEVVEAYKPEDMGGEWDDITRRYAHYRHTYQRTIGDLRHVLDDGQIPCPLMTHEERRRGDCDHAHADYDDNARTARKPRPTATVSGPTDDPWAADPQVEQDAAFRRIVTEHVVRVLLDPNEERGSEWARRLAWALKEEGVDLTDAIKARVTDLTLGGDPSEPPF